MQSHKMYVIARCHRLTSTCFLAVTGNILCFAVFVSRETFSINHLARILNYISQL